MTKYHKTLQSTTKTNTSTKYNLASRHSIGFVAFVVCVSVQHLSDEEEVEMDAEARQAYQQKVTLKYLNHEV